jgi:hypothetical protein
MYPRNILILRTSLEKRRIKRLYLNISRGITKSRLKTISPTAISIYSLSERELKALRKYIKKDLTKSYIRLSKLFIRYPILFVLKRNGKLRIHVDYRKLNDIIIKNRYTLSRCGMRNTVTLSR